MCSLKLRKPDTLNEQKYEYITKIEKIKIIILVI